MKHETQLELCKLLECLLEAKELKIMADVLIDINIQVNAAVQPLSADVSSVPDVATVGTPYSGVIKGVGGVPPYTFTDVSGQQNPPTNGFPPGVVLNPDGTITGTPTGGAGTEFLAVVDLADSAGAKAQLRMANRSK